MVMYDKEYLKKKIEFKPGIKWNYNINIEKKKKKKRMEEKVLAVQRSTVKAKKLQEKPRLERSI